MVLFCCSLTLSAQELLVAGAADLAPMQAPLIEAFGKATGVKVRMTFAASGTLARQIENGAPYDVFLSASESFVQQLAKSGYLLPNTVRVYAYGRLGVWSRTGQIRSLDDLLKPGVLHVAIANPLHAPYGMAARDLLQKRGLWEKLRGKIVYGENVQQAFQYAESGNADAVVTAWSLLLNRGGILLPADWHPPIRQTGAVVKGSKHPDLARRFLDFLTSGEGKLLLRKYGFD